MRTINRSPSGLGLPVSEAARHLGVSVSTVRRWADAGHLPGFRTPGGQRRFTVEQLDAFLASRAMDARSRQAG
jgi:excisionase family DNA binding protein